MNRLSHKLVNAPKTLFVIDGLGALISCVLLGFVLVRLKSIIGIKESTLYLLAAFPLFFSILDLIFYRSKDVMNSTFLYTIAIFNVLYCLLSISMAFLEKNISLYGWIYIGVEVLIVLLLAYFEWKVAGKLLNKKEQITT